MPWGPFSSANEFTTMIDWIGEQPDWLGYAIVSPENGPVGIANYLRISPSAGSIEVGGIAYTSVLQQTRAATEAMFLMADQAFSLGYRRYEWKCDDLNIASRNAALRLGFTYEGTHRQAMVYKGRNRDTAWYSILDGEWKILRPIYEQWLAPANFNESGRQLSSLNARGRADSEK